MNPHDGQRTRPFSRSSSLPQRAQKRQPSCSLMAGNDRLTAVHEQPEPTEEEQEQTPERIPVEEPDRDERSVENESEEPVREA
jgi:hypothetical protein